MALRKFMPIVALVASPGCLLFWNDDLEPTNQDSGSIELDTSGEVGCVRSTAWDCLPATRMATFPEATQGNGDFLAWAFTDTAAYVADPEGGAIYEVTLPEGPRRKLIDAPLAELYLAKGLAVGDGRIYYQTYEQQLVDTVFVDVRQLRSYTLPSGPEAVVAELDPTWDPSALYFHEGDVVYREPTGWRRRPADGTGSPTLVVEYGTELAFDGDTVFFLNGEALAKAPLSDPTSITVLTQDLGGASRLQVERSQAYFCTDVVYSAATDAPAIAEPIPLAGDPNHYACMEGFVVRDGTLYATRHDDIEGFGIAAYSHASGALQEHVVAGSYWTRVAHVDDTHAYFLGGGQTTEEQHLAVLYSAPLP